MAVIIKNTTNSIKTWGGLEYPANSQYSAEEVDRYRLLSDSQFLSDLSDGYAVVNNGSVDLTDIEVAKALIRALTSAIIADGSSRSTSQIRFFGNVAIGVADGGYTDITIGGGTGSGSLIGSSHIMTFTSTGSSDNKWLGCQEKDLKGNETLAIAPYNMDFVGYTVSSSDNNANCTFELWKSEPSSGSSKTKIYNLNITNFRTFYKMNITPVAINAGSKLAVYLKDYNGSDVQDPLVVLIFKVTGYSSTEIKENFSGDF